MFALVNTKIRPKKFIEYNNDFKRIPMENGWAIIHIDEDKNMNLQDFTDGDTNDLLIFECSSDVKVGDFYFDTDLNKIVEIPHAELSQEYLEENKKRLESILKIASNT
jgi:hypothetical protein